MPEISVIVPVYKVEPYLRSCVDSILGQTYTDFELILVDDGSPDHCPAICDEYAAKDSRVKVIHKPNGGVSLARNEGLNLARGEYITFVDSDDWIDCNFLQESMSFVKREGLDIFITGFNITELEEKVLNNIVIPNVISIQDGNITADEKDILLSRSYIAGPCAKIYARSSIGNIRFDTSLCYGEDLKFVFTVLDNCKKIQAVPECYYYYRTNPTSVTKTITEWKCESVRRTAEFLLDDCKRRYGSSELKYRESLCKRYIYDCKVQLEIIRAGHYPMKRKYKMADELLNSKLLRNEYQRFKMHEKYFSFSPFISILILKLRDLKKSFKDMYGKVRK